MCYGNTIIILRRENFVSLDYIVSVGLEMSICRLFQIDSVLRPDISLSLLSRPDSTEQILYLRANELPVALPAFLQWSVVMEVSMAGRTGVLSLNHLLVGPVLPLTTEGV